MYSIRESNRNTGTFDWEDLYHKNQLSILREDELQLYINHHNILFKGKKDEKVRVVKAHIGNKILTSIGQEKQTNIPLASDSNLTANNFIRTTRLKFAQKLRTS